MSVPCFVFGFGRQTFVVVNNEGLFSAVFLLKRQTFVALGAKKATFVFQLYYDKRFKINSHQ